MQKINKLPILYLQHTININYNIILGWTWHKKPTTNKIFIKKETFAFIESFYSTATQKLNRPRQPNHRFGCAQPIPWSIHLIFPYTPVQSTKEKNGANNEKQAPNVTIQCIYYI